MQFETLLFEVTDHVATVTLNRPQALNCFNIPMLREFITLWQTIRLDDDIHCVVLRAAGDRAFSAGADAKEGGTFEDDGLWTHQDPGDHLGPKRHKVWKPIVCAVHGICAGGAFYLVNESDIVICSSDSTFFDPHVTYGRTAAVEPIGMTYRMPLGEVMRMALLGNDERMSPRRALEIGLVSEITEPADLWARADELARIIAAKPPVAVQGTVKAVWESLDLPRTQALNMSTYYPITSKTAQKPIDISTIPRAQWKLR